jgi:hypothetical protein
MERKQRSSEKRDVLVTALPDSSLRWMKTRRKAAASHRVAISLAREKQLREIFNGLDFDSRKVIDFCEFAKVIAYAEANGFDQSVITMVNHMNTYLERPPSKSSTKKTSVSRDISYREFLSSITGRARNFIECATEDELGKLRFCFADYSLNRRRNFACAELDKVSQINNSSTTDGKLYCKFTHLLDSSPAKNERQLIPLPHFIIRAIENDHDPDLLDSIVSDSHDFFPLLRLRRSQER